MLVEMSRQGNKAQTLEVPPALVSGGPLVSRVTPTYF